MIDQLTTAYQSYKDTHHTFFKRIGGLTPEQLVFKPSPEEWSHLEVLEHILISEEGILKFFQKYNPALSERKVSLKAKAANAALTQFYKSPRKVKMPASSLAPTGKRSLEEMKIWSVDILAAITTFVENFPAEKLNYSVLKHPVAGGLGMKATINFLAGHIIHHNHQLDRIVAHPDFPKG